MHLQPRHILLQENSNIMNNTADEGSISLLSLCSRAGFLDGIEKPHLSTSTFKKKTIWRPRRHELYAGT